ncbi:MAG TPA: hypothetical protein V6D07_16810 [Trichocoleus sp.]
MGYPELIKYVCQPKSTRDIWPFVAHYTTVDQGVKHGVGYLDGPIISPHRRFNFAFLLCASGHFSIPLDRNSEAALDEARQFIDDVIAHQQINGMSFGGLMVRYEGKNKT